MMRISTSYADWPSWVESEYGPKPEERVDGDRLVITHINHSTMLIQAGGYNILTDPIYSDRCSPVSWAGPHRVLKPGIRFEDLPKIDIVLISHDHYDHLDIPTIEKLVERDGPRIFLGLGVSKHLDQRERVTELDWWESYRVSEKLRLHFVPVQHFSGRGLFDRNATLWGGYVLELAGQKIYFGGDAGYSSFYKETYERFGAMDVALLPIGAYMPRGFMAYAHMDPKEAVAAHLDLKSKFSIGMHYGTFQLTGEPYYEPTQYLYQELLKAGISPDSFISADFGNPIEVRSLRGQRISSNETQ